MTDTRSDIVSVVERTRLIAAGGAVVAFTFSGEPRSSVLSEEALAFAEPDGEMRRMAIHDGAILVMAADGERIVSGGDDGKAVTTDAGSSRLLATDPKHRWIDHIAVGPTWSRCCDTRRRKGERLGNTNFDLNRRVSPRPYR
jgi:hypothetical protein